jgi:Pentapeptide repeats (8 copies)
VPPLWYADVPDLNQRAADEASARTALIAGLVGLTALLTYRLSQQGQITDRYTKAVEQLGSDKLDVRLGGIYALERIAVDSKRDHPTVVEVFSAFVREHTDPARTDSAAGESKKPAADVQAALTVLGRLPHRKGVSRGDLRGALLMGAQLLRANLSGVLFFDANLSNATLLDANLSGAAFMDSNLSDALLSHADLSNAHLFETNLSRANLRDADLSDTWFHETNLSGADLQGAQLQVRTSPAPRG